MLNLDLISSYQKHKNVINENRRVFKNRELGFPNIKYPMIIILYT